MRYDARYFVALHWKTTKIGTKNRLIQKTIILKLIYSNRLVKFLAMHDLEKKTQIIK